MASLFKVMLAAHPSPEAIDKIVSGLTYPLLGEIKYDGVRCTVQNGTLYARSLKPIANKAMQALWGHSAFNGFDAEIIVGEPTAADCFNVSSGVVRNANASADHATLHVFDRFHAAPYRLRQDGVQVYAGTLYPHMQVNALLYTVLRNPDEVLAFEQDAVGEGHEGICLRSIDGSYKQGRSTVKEGGLIAIKRTVDTEAVVLDTYEQEENTNEQKVNELGKLKRSSHKGGKVGKGTLGGFVCLDLAVYKVQAGMWSLKTIRETAEAEETAFRIGTGVGLTEVMRKELWAVRGTLPGKIIKLRSMKVGAVEKPRQPIFLEFIGIRDKLDL